jgi:RNA polymerase sigma-70 factor (ECF subfamily)
MDATLAEQLEALHPSSYAWALSCCGRRAEDAEEVLQNVYLKVVEGKARFGGKSSLKTWLFAVIRKTAAEHFRWRRLRERFHFASSVIDEPPELHVQRRETAEQIVRALARLSARQREMLTLVFYHDLTIEEAAEILGVTIGSARVHYQRGKRRMLEQLSKEVQVAFA